MVSIILSICKVQLDQIADWWHLTWLNLGVKSYYRYASYVKNSVLAFGFTRLLIYPPQPVAWADFLAFHIQFNLLYVVPNRNRRNPTIPTTNKHNSGKEKFPVKSQKPRAVTGSWLAICCEYYMLRECATLCFTAKKLNNWTRSYQVSRLKITL